MNSLEHSVFFLSSGHSLEMKGLSKLANLHNNEFRSKKHCKYSVNDTDLSPVGTN